MLFEGDGGMGTEKGTEQISPRRLFVFLFDGLLHVGLSNSESDDFGALREFGEQLCQREDEQSCRQISNSVQQVKWNTHDNPTCPFLKGIVEHQRLCGGIENSG